MGTRRRLLRIPWAVLATLVVAGACSSGGGEREAVEPASTKAIRIGTLEGARAARLPLGFYLDRGAADRDLSELARTSLLTDCMRKQGYDYVAPNNTAAYVDHWSAEHRYGQIDEVHASTYGYHVAESDSPTGTSQAATTQGAGYRDALLGTPKKTPGGNLIPASGCMKEVTTDLQGDIGRYWDLQTRLIGLAADAYERAMASPTARDAIAAWAQCLRDRGIAPTDDPLAMDAPFHVPEDGLGTPSADEIRTAVADVECKLSSGYVNRLFHEESRVENQVMSDHEADLAEFRDLQSAEMDRVKKLALRPRA